MTFGEVGWGGLAPGSWDSSGTEAELKGWPAPKLAPQCHSQTYFINAAILSPSQLITLTAMLLPSAL
jgi:hypothetical protein